MARLDPRSLAWGVQRWFLVRGAAAWVIACGALLLLACVLLLVVTIRHHADMKARWGDQTARTERISDAAGNPPASLTLPGYEDRFEYTQRVLEALDVAGPHSEKATISWERRGESGLVMQTLSLQMQAPWEQIGGLLDRAQVDLHTGYIGRLSLTRDSANEAVVDAGLQFTVVYRESTEDGAE